MRWLLLASSARPCNPQRGQHSRESSDPRAFDLVLVSGTPGLIVQRFHGFCRPVRKDLLSCSENEQTVRWRGWRGRTSARQSWKQGPAWILAGGFETEWWVGHHPLEPKACWQGGVIPRRGLGGSSSEEPACWRRDGCRRRPWEVGEWQDQFRGPGAFGHASRLCRRAPCSMPSQERCKHASRVSGGWPKRRAPIRRARYPHLPRAHSCQVCCLKTIEAMACDVLAVGACRGSRLGIANGSGSRAAEAASAAAVDYRCEPQTR